MTDSSSVAPWTQLSRVELIGAAPLHDLWALLVDVRGWTLWNDFYVKADPSGRFVPQMTIGASLKDGSAVTWTLIKVTQGEKILMTGRRDDGVELALETNVGAADDGLTKLTRSLCFRSSAEVSPTVAPFNPTHWVECQQRFLNSTVEVFALAMPEFEE